mgnify:CR=1 FL=1
MTRTPTDTALTYISFVLSVISLTLFVISGFQVSYESSRDQKAVSTSYVWMYNTSTNIAKVRDGVSTVCIGFTDDECAAAAASAPHHSRGLATVRIKDALQLGEKVFRVVDGGSTLLVKQGDDQVLRVDLTTGATVVGFGNEMPERGTKIVGQPSDGRDDSEMWLATSKVDLYAPGGSLPTAVLSNVQHRHDALLTGIRVTPYAQVMESGGRGMVATSAGVIVGDPPLNFIEANRDQADVLVFGSAYCGNTVAVGEAPACTGAPLHSLEMENSTYHQLLRVRVDSCKTPDYIQSAEVINYMDEGFAGCLSGWVFWQGGREQVELGKCHETELGKFIYYCRVTTAIA